MKKIFILCVMILILPSCIWDMYPMYGVMNMGYWVDRNGNKASDEIEVECSDYPGTNLESYAQCMVQKGYHFYTKSFAYCYRFPEECKIYNKYQ